MKNILIAIAIFLVIGLTYFCININKTTDEPSTNTTNPEEVNTDTITPDELPPLQANSWYWKETLYNNDTIVSANKPSEFLVTFKEDDQFSATTDCNNGFGNYTIENNELTFGPIAATEKACAGETQETEFFNMLGEVHSYFITEAGDLALQLKFDSGVIILTPAR